METMGLKMQFQKWRIKLFETFELFPHGTKETFSIILLQFTETEKNKCTEDCELSG